MLPHESVDPEDYSKSTEVKAIAKDNERSQEDVITSSRTQSRALQSNSHGGSWTDSFEDDTGIDFEMSDHLNLSDGEVKINIDMRPLEVDNNTAGLWHFDEGIGTTAYDASTNDNDGTLGGNGVGTDIPTWTTAGKFGDALNFDGVDDYVDCGNNDSLNIQNELTMAAWIKVESLFTSFQVIMAKGAIYVGPMSYFRGGYALGIVSGGSSYCRYMFDVYTKSGSNYARNASTIDIPDTYWHFLALTFNSGSAKGYLDGELKTNFSTTYTQLNTPIYNLTFGINPRKGRNYFDGSLDDVMILNRSLTTQEIAAIYKNGTNKFSHYGNLTSNEIEIPYGMHWDTFIINKIQPGRTYLNITILNASNNQPIPRTPTYVENGEFDISYIDPVIYPSIKLNATLVGNKMGFTPILHYWGVSWNASDTWCDTLYGGVKVESTQNVEALDGNVQLTHDINDPSTKALWHFDEGTGQVAADSSGNGNDGQLGSTPMGDVNDPTWTAGKVGGGLEFDGIDDYIDCGNSQEILGEDPNEWSYEAWFKTDHSGDLMIIMTDYNSHGNNYDQTYAICAYIWPTSIIRVDIRYNWDDISLTTSQTFTDNQWHNMVVTVSKENNIIKLFVDGDNLDNDILPYTTGHYFDNDILRIGAENIRPIGISNFFDGVIDECAIYNRALTAQEIQDHYENCPHYYPYDGSLISKPISLSTNTFWNTLIINKNEPVDTYANISILDATSNMAIPSFENLVGTNIDISPIDPILYNSIRLKASFGSNGFNTPTLHDWSVNWTVNTAPQFLDIFSAATVYRTMPTTITINMTDHEDSEENLTLQLEYQSPFNTNWQTEYITDTYYSIDQWNATFLPGKEAEVGFYSFRVIISDSVQFLNISIHTDSIQVLNNKPTPPNASISPVEPNTKDDLIGTADNSSDIETPSEELIYVYRWYRNDAFLPELGNTRIISNNITQKGDIWRCEVYVNDGDGFGMPGVAEVIIQNSPPELVALFTTIEILEDMPIILEGKLFSIFNDSDSDPLTYTPMGQENIDVEIYQEDGTIKLTPADNWFGEEAITFYANDTYSTAALETVLIMVKPTNDLPRIVQIGDRLISENYSDLGFSVKQDQWLNLTIVAEDIDGDVERGIIEYIMNQTENNNFYMQKNTSTMIFLPNNTQVGRHYINISITDNNETPPIFISYHFWIEVENINDPPSVKIVSPLSGKEFKITDNITFSCVSDDPDLLIPQSNESFTYQWYTNKTSNEMLGTKQQINLTNHSLAPGYYNIIVLVKDVAGETAFDSVDIIIKDVSESPLKSETKKGTSSSSWWLWIVVILTIVVVIGIATWMRSKKAKTKIEKAGAPQLLDNQVIKVAIHKPSDAQIITAEIVTPSETTPSTLPPTPPVKTPLLRKPVKKIKLLPAGPKSFDVKDLKRKKKGKELEDWDLKDSGVGKEGKVASGDITGIEDLESEDENESRSETIEDKKRTESKSEPDSGAKEEVSSANSWQEKVKVNTVELAVSVEQERDDIDDLFEGLQEL